MIRKRPSAHGAALLAALAIVGTCIADAGAQDLSVSAIRSPVGGCALTAAENVTIRLFNYGSNLPAGTTFNLAYTLNAGAPVVELAVLGSTLLSNSRFDYTFTTQANLSVPGTYTFDATVSLAGDITPTTNALSSYHITNSAPAIGGTLSGPTTPSASGTLTLADSYGDIVQWEESDDGGLRWFALANTSTSQDYAELRAPTQFRVRVHSGACDFAFPGGALSNVVTVSP
jgi:hypothetical protein